MRGMTFTVFGLAAALFAGCYSPSTPEPRPVGYDPSLIGVNNTDYDVERSITKYTDAERNNYAHPCVSYDGEWLAYTSTVNDTQPQVFVQRKGKHAARQVSMAGRNIHPSLSYDSKWVAYSSNFQGNYRVYLVSLSGTGPMEEIGDPNGDNIAPSWSPDGKRIAYATRRSASSPWVIAVHDRNSNQTTFLGRGVLPSWSPDGSKLVFQRANLSGSGYASIFTCKPDGSEETMVYHSDTHGAITPSWAGRDWILFATVDKSKASLMRDGVDMFNADDVWMVKSDGTQPRMVTSHRMADWDPCYDNKNREILFVSNRNGAQNIYGMKSNLSGESEDSGRLFGGGGR